jgi:hypothetical protein
MPKRHSTGQKHHGPEGSDGPEPESARKRSGWQAGHLPHMPGAASGEEPDWVTGFLKERVLDGLFQDGAGDQEHPEEGAGSSVPR